MASSKHSKPASYSLVEMAQKQGPPPARGTKAWIDKLPPEHRGMLLELRDAWRAGKLAGWTARTMFEDLVIPAGIDTGISLQTFRVWIFQRAGEK